MVVVVLLLQASTGVALVGALFLLMGL